MIEPVRIEPEALYDDGALRQALGLTSANLAAARRSVQTAMFTIVDGLARLIAPILPSIMSDGARMSQPASACTRAWLINTSTVSSLAISPSIKRPS